ncbi:MAG: S46 family peptidase [Pseudobdellovibrionaceae bacterium]|nr:S46 family peptidase [Pseudobdellovibrionaceae bacterium]
MINNLNKIAFVAGLVWSEAVFGAAGMWNQHDLKAGLEAASWPSTGFDQDIKRLVDEAPAVVRIRRCTGAFVTSTGLLMTGYDCALPTLVKHSCAGRDLVKNGYHASTPDEELKADLDFGIGVTVDSEDVTTRILDGIPGRILSKADYAKIQERKKTMEEDCGQGQSLTCSVQEISGATRFILKKTVELKDFRLVFAPPLAAGNRQNRMMERQADMPEAGFAIFRSYGGFQSKPGKRTKPLRYFRIRKEPLEPDEPVYVPSYTWRYKRHLGATVMYEAITGGLYDALSTGWGEAIARAVAEEAQHDPQIRNLYLQKIQGQNWQEAGVDRLIAAIHSSEALRELRAFEQSVLNLTATQWTAEERKILDGRLAVYRQDFKAGALASILGRLTELDSMAFVSWSEKAAAQAKPDTLSLFQQQFAERKVRFDLPTEARLMSLTLDMVQKESVHANLELPAEVKFWINKSDPIRTAELKKMFATSKAFDVQTYVVKSDLSSDPLLKLRGVILLMLETYPESTDAERAPYDYTYYRALKEFSRAAGLPFYEGETQELLTWAFGKVKVLQKARLPIGSQSVAIQNFLSSADVGIRRSIGAPTLDAKGRFVGVYSTLDERDLFLDWYYNENQNTAIHTGVETIRNTLLVSGAKALIKELQL